MLGQETNSTQIQRCLDRLHAGDRSAQSQLIQHAYERLHRLARKMLRRFPELKRWEQTDDVLQNCWHRFERQLDRAPPRSVQHFFRLAAQIIRQELIDLARHLLGPEGIGANHFSDVGNSSTSRKGIVERAEEPRGEPSSLAAWADFHECVDQLPEQEREVVDLLYYQGLSQADAAALIIVSLRTIKRRWRSARLLLRQRLDGISLP